MVEWPQLLSNAAYFSAQLIEGNSVSTVERITGVHHTTILNLLVLRVKNASASWRKRFAICRCTTSNVTRYGPISAKRVRPEDDPNLGDAYTFVVIERHSKLVLNIGMGKCDQRTTNTFIEGLSQVVAPRQNFQITTDEFCPYIGAIDATLGHRVDFAQLIKIYRSSQEGEARYSPAEVASTEVVSVIGQPDPERICTSIVECSNLSLRMSARRFTRLTNAFSKKGENHWAAVALWFTFYNFCRIHKSLRVTPAVAAGITDHVWTLAELLNA